MNKQSKKALIMMTVAVMLMATVLTAFAVWQIHNYEQGVAELYAQEQDGYVEIVARQIELYGDIAGDAFVEDTIEMLDSTSQRYWTLDNSEYFLFVKSISETNVYKTFSTDTFYNTQSAQSFLSTLVQGKVKHAIISLEGTKYVASGIIFEYNGTEYRLCLLTDYDIMLTNNAYLSSKLYLLIVLILLIALLIIAVIYFTMKLIEARKKVDSIKAVNTELNNYIDYLDNVVMGRNQASIITGEGRIMRLLHRIDERRIYPCAFVRIKLETGAMMSFYEKNSKLLGDDVVWLRYCKDGFMLLFGVRTAEQAMKIIESKIPEAEIPEDILAYNTDDDLNATGLYEALVNA
ncbi:MAG: hypothetical protein E7383_02270 [Ruminococcaceae bacterium]|nr:hypothetical protein [Oscillospiraceae bacterium]MBR2597947.1 hypothetical protein [Clostridiales bacterium]